MRTAPIVLALAVLALGAQSACACISDREVRVAEQEFRSQYQAPTATQAAGDPLARTLARPLGGFSPAGFGFMGFGLLAMAGGIAVTRRRP